MFEFRWWMYRRNAFWTPNCGSSTRIDPVSRGITSAHLAGHGDRCGAQRQPHLRCNLINLSNPINLINFIELDYQVT